MNRRIVRDALNEFIQTLIFRNEKVLKNLFLCGTSWVDDEDGKQIMVCCCNRWNGYWNSWFSSSFSRPFGTIEAVQFITTLQYIIRLPKLREFVDAIFVSAKRNEEEDEFKLQLKFKLHGVACTLKEKFFATALEIEQCNGKSVAKLFI